MNIAPPIDGQWYWVHIPHHEDAYDKDGSEWSLAMRDSKESAGGWNNEDTWEDFRGEVDAWAGPIVAPDEVLKLDADEEKFAKAGRAGAAAGEKLRDALPATPDPRRLLDASALHRMAPDAKPPRKGPVSSFVKNGWDDPKYLQSLADNLRDELRQTSAVTDCLILEGRIEALEMQAAVEVDKGAIDFLRCKPIPQERSDRNTGAMCGTCVSLLIPVSEGYPCDGCGSEGDEPGFDD